MPAVSGLLRVMAAVPRLHLAHPAKNAEEIAALLDIADEKGAGLCVFPQLCLTGSACGDLFYQPTLIRAAAKALADLALRDTKTVFVVGLPLEIGGRLYACSAVVSKHQIVIVPKTRLCADGGTDESRWFAPGASACGAVRLPGIPQENVRVCADAVIDCGSFTLGVAPGCDLSSPLPLSGSLSLGGASIIAMPAFASETAQSHAARLAQLAALSAGCLCACVYAGAGYGESTTDAVFSGFGGVFEDGVMLAGGDRFARHSSYTLADVDTERIAYRRCSHAAFRTGSHAPQLCALPAEEAPVCLPLLRPLAQLPFVPEGEAGDCALLDALNIQAQGLIRRMEQIRTKKLVVGVSGGLDSTLALLAAAYAYALAGWDKTGIVGITMPGFGTGTRTKGNADKLMEAIGCTRLTIPIGPAVTQHFSDIGQSPDVQDICYENSQARERTQIVMDYANKIGALALGTGDLSELALGWCTYNGDHMSMYNLNGSVPKTLMRKMVARAAQLLGEDIVPIVQDIVDTPISPELLPGKNGEIAQKTEDTLGAYELHDFFLYHMMDAGAGPGKLFALACQAFGDTFSREAILSALRIFVRRFFTQQFKRSALPDGPKVTFVSLSPRGSWQMPSDAQMQLWLDELESIAL